MMKRFFAFVLALSVIFIFAACSGNGNDANNQSDNNADVIETESVNASEEGGSNARDNTSQNEEDENSTDVQDDSTQSNDEELSSNESSKGDSDSIVIYFSRTGEQYGVGEIDKGNTEIVAEIIAEQTGADLYEIVPENDYYPKTYDELTDVASQEQAENLRPAYKDNVPDLSSYTKIYVGAPVWWGDWPMIMYTFFENEDLSDKILIPFSTHAGSGLSGFDEKLRNVLPENIVLNGLAILGADAQNTPDVVKDAVASWLEEIEE